MAQIITCTGHLLFPSRAHGPSRQLASRPTLHHGLWVGLPEHSPPFLCPRPLSAAPLSALASTRCVRLNPRRRLASGRAVGAAARGVEGGSWLPAAISPRPDGQAAAHLRLEAGALRRRLLQARSRRIACKHKSRSTRSVNQIGFPIR